MKKLHTFLAGVLTLAGLAIFTSGARAAEATRDTHAIARAVHGDVSYIPAGGTTPMPLHPNMELSVGDTVITGVDGKADFSVNGRTSTVRVVEQTTIKFTKMDLLGNEDNDSETQLDLSNGTALGSVKKISGDSSYRISTPRGVAGIRGTDWSVAVVPNGNGTYTVTFTSVTGAVIVVANINVGGAVQQFTKTLNTGQAWTPPESVAVATAIADVVNLTPDQLNQLQQQIPIVIPTGPTTTTGPVTITYIPPAPTSSTTGGTTTTP